MDVGLEERLKEEFIVDRGACHNMSCFTLHISLPHIAIELTFSDELIPGQVGVVWGRDEVTGEGLVHVLVHRLVGLVEQAAVFGLHVPEEPLKRQGSALSGWSRRKENRIFEK